jgi:hypothetical protein
MQTITSAKTSVKQIPALHKEVASMLYGDVLDYGGGKYETAKEWVETNTTSKLFVYDPYNRSEEHNNKSLECKTNIVLCANVLNVIKEKESRLAMLKHIKALVRGRCNIYFSVYKAIRNKKYVETSEFVGQPSNKGWQNCQLLKFYAPELHSVFQDSVQITETTKYICVHY